MWHFTEADSEENVDLKLVPTTLNYIFGYIDSGPRYLARSKYPRVYSYKIVFIDRGVLIDVCPREVVKVKENYLLM